MKINLLVIISILSATLLGCEAPPDSFRLSDQTIVGPAMPTLKLLASRVEDDGPYMKISGQVKNISNEKIDCLWVFVTNLDVNEGFISSEDAVVEYTPLMPHQTTSFLVVIRRNPLMKHFDIAFKTTLGDTIDYIGYIDARLPRTKNKKKK